VVVKKFNSERVSSSDIEHNIDVARRKAMQIRRFN
jgi:hypothetical protein